MRGLGAGLYALAAACTLLTGAGLVVAPHRVPLGTPLVHEHPVSALRFPLLLVAEAPGIPEAAALRDAASSHAAHAAPTDRTVPASFMPAHELALLAAGMVVALLSAVVPRLPRPTRHVVAELPVPGIPATQWRTTLMLPPPRSPIFAA